MLPADMVHRQDTEPPAATDAAERFTARDTSGQAFVIEKLASVVRENAMHGLEWADGGPRYRLSTGQPVEWVDESTFRVPETGETLRREEGDHGVTHHPEHQTAARP